MKTGYLIMLILLSQSKLIAQVSNRKHIDLKAVQRFELVEGYGGISGGHLEYRVERDNANSWISTRIKDGRDGRVTETIPKGQVTRNIPTNYLIDLLKFFANPVMTKNITQFKISQDTLISYLDSMIVPISAQRKSAIVKDIRNQYNLQKAFELFLEPTKADDKTLYQIKLIMIQGDTIVAKALSFSNPYLPWEIDGVRIYDPELTRLYDYLRHNERNEPHRRQYFYRMLTLKFLRLDRLVLQPNK
jgi:hypothetical protein